MIFLVRQDGSMIPIIKNRGRLTECKTRFPGDLIYHTFCKRCDGCRLWKVKKPVKSTRKKKD